MGAYYSAARFSASVVLGLLSGWEVKGREHIPRRGGLVVASNHVSYWDPPMVGAAIGRRETYYLAKEELFAHPILGPMLRSVNSIPIRRGAADLRGLTAAIEAVKQGKILVLFPEGSRMKDGALHPARPGLGLISVQADAHIVPCYISGSNRPRSWLLRQSHVRISFGPARHWRELAGVEAEGGPGRTLYQKLGDRVMHEIAQLKHEQEASASRGAA